VSFAPSKFTHPLPRVDRVPRPQLCDRLDGDASSVGAVIGSAGSGKSTVLAEWYESRPAASTAWINIDEGDRSPLRFWLAFVTAARRCVPAFADECLDLVRLDASIDQEFFERLLIAVGALDRRIAVVLDDFHLAGDEVHQQVGFLLTRDVQPMRIVFGARFEPQLGLHRLRLDGRVCELRDADLRFGRADAGLLLERLGATMPDGGLDAVMQRTEGWAAGLQLTALALRESDDPSDFVERLTSTTKVVAQYLWTEVFARQRPVVQRFLLETCILDELSPELAAHLSPGRDVTLFDIEAANLFLQRVDPAGRTFRYHHLLAAMLRLRLRAEDPEAEAVLHERAAAFLEARGERVAAFSHRWRAGRRSAALRVMHGTVLDVAYDLLPTMSDGERALSDDDVRRDPGPALSFAIALIFNGFAGEAHRLGQRVRAFGLDQLTSIERDQLTVVEVASALILGDHAAVVEFDDRLAWDEPPTGPWAATARSCVTRGHVWQRRFDDAERRLGQQLPRNPTPFERQGASGTLSQLQLFRGELDACQRTIDAAFAELDRDGSGANNDGLLLEVVGAVVAAERGRFAEAESALRAALTVNPGYRAPAGVLACVTLSRLCAIDGDLDSALVMVDDAFRRLRSRATRTGIHDFIRRQQVRVLTWKGVLDEAERVANEIEVDLVARELATIELHVARRDVALAEHHFERLAEAAHTTVRDRIEVALSRMNLELAAGRPMADKYATAALNTATSDGFILPFAELSSSGLVSIQRAARRFPRTRIIEAVLRLIPRVDPSVDVEHRGVDVLSARERAILRYLATSLSYGEIADELFVSRNTVKTHVKNISQKLGVTSRPAIIERATALRYI
jgi:LuxR family maltose regulon positive regulatory protein